MRKITVNDREKFIKKFNELSNGEYTCLDEYMGVHQPTLFQHNSIICNNYAFKMRPADFYKGQRCPYCSGRVKHQSDIYESSFNKKYNNKFNMVSKWIDNKNNIQIECCKCGHIQSINPKKALHEDIECYCQQLISEKSKIADALILNKIQFQQNYTLINKLFTKSAVKFDFVIKLDKSNILAIDYCHQGYFKKNILGEDLFNAIKLTNTIKQNYCELNQNIFWLKINFWNLKKINQIINLLNTFMNQNKFTPTNFVKFRRSLDLGSYETDGKKYK